MPTSQPSIQRFFLIGQLPHPEAVSYHHGKALVRHRRDKQRKESGVAKLDLIQASLPYETNLCNAGARICARLDVRAAVVGLMPTTTCVCPRIETLGQFLSNVAVIFEKAGEHP